MLQIPFKFVSFLKSRKLACQATFSDFVAFFKKYYKNFLENINFKKVFNKIFEICNKAKNWLKNRLFKKLPREKNTFVIMTKGAEKRKGGLMIDNTFYGEDVRIGAAVNKHETPEIPVIAMSVLDGREHWFPSLTHSSDSLNVSENGISLCLRGELYQSGCYHFRYADEKPIDPQSQNLEALAEWRHKIIESSNRKPVIATNLEDGSEHFFQSVRMAAKELGVHSTYISRAINGGKITYPVMLFVTPQKKIFVKGDLSHGIHIRHCRASRLSRIRSR